MNVKRVCLFLVLVCVIGGALFAQSIYEQNIFLGVEDNSDTSTGGRTGAAGALYRRNNQKRIYIQNSGDKTVNVAVSYTCHTTNSDRPVNKTEALRPGEKKYLENGSSFSNLRIVRVW
jgi:hypothetical protein